VFGDLGECGPFVEELASDLRRLYADGARATLAACLAADG
jgi:hypothetical protein